jgi:hypothetical protein
MSTGYDYTKDSQDDSEGYAIRSFVPPTKTADEIAKENGFRDIPPGKHVLVVAAVTIKAPELFRVMLGGKLTSFLSATATVRLSLPSDPRASIMDNFILPPDNPAEARAYSDGHKPAGNGPNAKDGQAGLPCNKFYHFADRLGIVDAATGNLTAAGSVPTKWKGRAIVATVKAGSGTYTDKKTGEVKAGMPNIQMFSYDRADAAAVGARLDAAQGGRPASASDRQPVGAGAGGGRGGAIGYDDI